jgi:hypothetical protein
MDYLKLLEDSYAKRDEYMSCPPDSKLSWLGDQVFGFVTYEDEMSEFFATKAIDVCKVISNGTTYDYIGANEENRRWYLMMCNLPFFASAIDWGGSIRGAWWSSPWDEPISYRALWAFQGDEQIVDDMHFTTDQWREFIAAIIQFAHDEVPLATE